MPSKDSLLFGLSEVCIYPKAISTIRTRAQCDPYINGNLPLFTAPMSSVVDETSYEIYVKNKINVVLPRNIPFEKRIKYLDKCFVAMGLGETEEFCKKNKGKLMKLRKIMICIDIANGHMDYMQKVIRELKIIFKSKLVIMCGNIANPVTFRYLSEAGADYIRCGIGGGSGCLTASNTGIFYPMGSLIVACKKIQRQMELSHHFNKNSPKPAKIVADGGMKNYDYINKALFLGADYCMCGRMLSQCWEAPGEIWCRGKQESNNPVAWVKIDKSLDKAKITFRPDINEYKKIFYGMSTKKAQKEIAQCETTNNVKFKTSEGLIKEIPVNHTIAGWVENFISYLTSAMSYVDCRNLKAVKAFDDYRLMTQAASESYNR